MLLREKQKHLPDTWKPASPFQLKGAQRADPRKPGITHFHCAKYVALTLGPLTLKRAWHKGTGKTYCSSSGKFCIFRMKFSI